MSPPPSVTAVPKAPPAGRNEVSTRPETVDQSATALPAASIARSRWSFPRAPSPRSGIVADGVQDPPAGRLAQAVPNCPDQTASAFPASSTSIFGTAFSDPSGFEIVTG